MRLDRFERRRGIERKTDAALPRANRAQCLRNIMFRFGFDMDRDRGRARLEEARQVMIGMFDHEMHVERKLRLFSHGRDQSRSERNVIDEVAVHDVEVQPICARFFGPMDLAGEIGKIGGEDGRSDEDFFGAS